MPIEICKQCGEMMTEQEATCENANFAGTPRHSSRFYEQWFVCPRGHRRGYISGHSRSPGDMRLLSQTDVISIRT